MLEQLEEERWPRTAAAATAREVERALKSCKKNLVSIRGGDLDKTTGTAQSRKLDAALGNLMKMDGERQLMAIMHANMGKYLALHSVQKSLLERVGGRKEEEEDAVMDDAKRYDAMLESIMDTIDKTKACHVTTIREIGKRMGKRIDSCKA